jgi:hypothetical protein
MRETLRLMLWLLIAAALMLPMILFKTLLELEKRKRLREHDP